MIFEGTYQDRFEDNNFRFNGAFKTQDGTNTKLMDNHVAGAERVAFSVQGVPCGRSDGPSGNVAHSSLFGLVIFPNDKLVISARSCVQISSYTFWRCRDAGLYYNNKVSVLSTDNIFVENGLHMYFQIFGPDSVTHQAYQHNVEIMNSIFVGATSSFDCTTDALKTDDNIRLARKSSNSWTNGSHVAFSIPAFMAGMNNAPQKPFFNIKTYPAIKGRTSVHGK